MATAKKKPSAAQLAARAKFAAAAKAGTLRKKNPIVSGYNRLTRADLVETFGAGNVKFKRNGEIYVFGKMPNTNKNGWYLHSYAINAEKRAKNPVKKPSVRHVKGGFGWVVRDEIKGEDLAQFGDKAKALEYAKAYANAHNRQVSVNGK